MRIYQLILEELGRPDDQRRSWYDWAENQLSHVCLGILITSTFLFINSSALVAVGSALLLGVTKEAHDYKVSPSKGTFRDNCVDLYFECLGITFAYTLVSSKSDIFLAQICMLIGGLLAGVLKRIQNLEFSGGKS